MNFEFDPKKTVANLRKHGVAFAEIELVFYDDFALTREDDDAMGEARFVTVGTDTLGRVVAVCWTQRGQHLRCVRHNLPQQQRESLMKTNYDMTNAKRGLPLLNQ